MAKLVLFWPVKPLGINQAFGILNPSYKQFNFTRHNGIDFRIKDRQVAYAMCDAYVTEVGENSSAGKYVKIRTTEPVEAEGHTGVVCLMYMHGAQIFVEKGMQVKAGTPLMFCDNTGFSTGYHLHVSAFFVDASGAKEMVGSAESDWCFDFAPYVNGMFAEDAQSYIYWLHQLLAAISGITHL